MQYRKRPVVIDAIQWNGSNLIEITEFIEGKKIDASSFRWDDYEDLVFMNGLTIRTLEGEMKASIGDYIIKGVNGEFYPCKPDIFEKTYELLEVQNG